jgi:hypothetical protein
MKKSKTVWTIRGENFHIVLRLAAYTLNRDGYDELGTAVGKFAMQAFRQLPADVELPAPQDNELCNGKTQDQIRSLYVGYFFTKKYRDFGRQYLIATGLFDSQLTYIGSVKQVDSIFAKMKKDGIIGPVPSDKIICDWLCAFGTTTTPASLKAARSRSKS